MVRAKKKVKVRVERQVRGKRREGMDWVRRARGKMVKERKVRR